VSLFKDRIGLVSCSVKNVQGGLLTRRKQTGQWRVRGVVVGTQRGVSGSESQMQRKIRKRKEKKIKTSESRPVNGAVGDAFVCTYSCLLLGGQTS
jgi:hypothetical protein